VFIDVFIGVWAVHSRLDWSAKIETPPRREVRAVEIWQRFPKSFWVTGYISDRARHRHRRSGLIPKVKARLDGASQSVSRHFFSVTFFAIGVLSNFRKLWQEGIAKLARFMCFACLDTSFGRSAC